MSVFTKNGKVLLHDGKGLNLDSLIALANATTGEDDKTLADAVASLIEGYGGIEIPVPDGYQFVSNSFQFTPSADTLYPGIELEHGLGCLPMFILCYVDDISDITDNNKNTWVYSIYYSGSGFAKFLDRMYINQMGGVPFLPAGSLGEYYSRKTDNVIRSESSNNYSIKDVNESTFTLGYSDSPNYYSWVGGVTLNIYCYGLKEVQQSVQ